MIYQFLFPTKLNDKYPSMLLLAFRLLLGILLMSHGLGKLMNFSQLADVFPDPLSIGSTASLSLAIFAELFCAFAFTIGLLYRLALLPMIFTMIIAVFVIHGNDPLSAKELAFTYLASYIILYFAGPGRYSIDYLIQKRLNKAH